MTVTLPEPHRDVGVCHCTLCRKWGSGPWMALQVPGASISGDTLRVYESSGFAERGFCKLCGTHIFHRPKGGPELAISAGLFDTRGFYVDREIFFDSRPSWYRFEADSRKRTQLSMAVEWIPKMIWRRIKWPFSARNSGSRQP